MKRYLVLIRHSNSLPDPRVSADQWGLSAIGVRRLQLLFPHLAGYRCERVYSSPEPKALQTAEFVAGHIDVHIEVHENLREHDRRNVPWLDSQEEFDAQVKQMLQFPDQRVFGTETADQAVIRFGGAINDLMMRSQGFDVIAATHGTVLSLFVAQHNQIDSIDFWSKLGMPAIVVMSLPGFELVSVVERL